MSLLKTKNDHIFATTHWFCAAVAMLAASMNVAIAETSAGEEARVVEEIVVTARKREESLQDAPVVISALSKKTISDFAIESVEDISDFTPGLIADTQGLNAGGLIYLRGIGSATAAANIDQAVSLVIDDMQVGSLQIQHAAMIDMESVQVYKGPQALFFGKNSPGGVLSIKTADPGDEFEAEAKTGYEFETDKWFVQGMVSSPFSDTAAGRLVVRYSDSKGFWNYETAPFDDFIDDGRGHAVESLFARGTLVLTPTDDLRIRAKLTYNDNEADTSGTMNLHRIGCPFGDPQGGQAASYPCKADDTHYVGPISQVILDAFAGVGFEEVGPSGAYGNEQVLSTIALDWDVNDELTLSSVTGYYDVTSLTSAATFGLRLAPAVAASTLDFKQFTQELRLVSDFDGPFNFVGGIYFEDKKHEHSQPVALGSGFVVHAIYEQNAEAISVFADLSWNMSDNLVLSAGARYSDEEKEFVGVNNYAGDLSPKETWDDVSPQVTLTYTPDDNWMLFASYREGFKSGGYDGAFSFAPGPISSYEPESVDGFEVGAKGTLLDNTLQLNVAAFSYEYQDLQLSSLDAATLSLAIHNAAGAELKGIETDFVWVTSVEGLLARGAIGILDTEFTDYEAPCYGGQSIAQGCDLAFDGTRFIAQDLSGASLHLAPEFTATIGLAYERALGNLRLGLSLDAVYNDDYETSEEQMPGTTMDSHTKVNASIRLSSIEETWSVSLIGRNLTDEFTWTSGGDHVGTGSGTGTNTTVAADVWAWMRPGRTVAIEFQYSM